jgi:hypothetical protein
MDLLIIQLKADIVLLKEKLEEQEDYKKDSEKDHKDQDKPPQIKSVVVRPEKNPKNTRQVYTKVQRCDPCAITFAHYSSLRHHNIRFHNQTTRFFRCETCFAEFARKDILIRHFNTIHKKPLYNSDYTMFTKSNDPKDNSRPPKTWIPPQEARPKITSNNPKFRIIPGNNAPANYIKEPSELTKDTLPSYITNNTWLPYKDIKPISPINSPEREMDSNSNHFEKSNTVIPLMEVEVDLKTIDKYTTKKYRKTEYKRSLNSDSESSIDTVQKSTSTHSNISTASKQSESKSISLSISTTSNLSVSTCSSNTSLSSSNSGSNTSLSSTSSTSITSSKSTIQPPIDPLLEFLNTLPDTKPHQEDFKISLIANQQPELSSNITATSPESTTPAIKDHKETTTQQENNPMDIAMNIKKQEEPTDTTTNRTAETPATPNERTSQPADFG